MASDMKKNIFRVTCSALLVTLIIFPIAVFAYTFLEPLPGINECSNQNFTSPCQDVTLSSYLGWLYKFALAAAAFLAVLMIVIGGIQMIVGGASETARSDGKKRIEQAIWGLLLAITAWLILYSINPDLVKTGLTIPNIEIEAPVAAGVPVSSINATDSQRAAYNLISVSKQNQVLISSSASCGSGSDPKSVIEQAATGKPIVVCSAGCHCSPDPKITLNSQMLTATSQISATVKTLTITSVTGGEHTENSDHYKGKALDVVPASSDPKVWQQVVDSYKSKGASQNQTSCDLNGKLLPCANVAGKSGGHIHVSYNI